MKRFRIALAGNPNCGKTTLFNILTGSRQHVGNWAGVTVEKKEGSFSYKGYEFEMIDLPGIYSLSPNSIEEIVSRNYILNDKPDMVINVIDGTTLERSLYLTAQLIDAGADIAVAVNMFDEVEKKGIKIDLPVMETLLRMPVVPISAKKEEGIKELLDRIILKKEKGEKSDIRIDYGVDIENAITDISCRIICEENLSGKLDPRWLSIHLLSGDEETDRLMNGGVSEEFSAAVSKHLKNLFLLYGDLESVVSEKRFGFAMGIVRECVTQKKFDFKQLDYTELIDNIILNKVISFPIFALILWLTFQLTFLAGGFFSGFINQGVGALGSLIGVLMPQGMLKDLLLGGVISGVGGILVFLPQILILFLFIAILEDTGYMARVAFIMDRLMHFLGVHGKSFISLFMGIGCNVPGIMAARTLENEEDRKVTVLINPFMSCSARLPIYVLIAGIFFGKSAGSVIFFLYFLGILVAIATAKLLKVFFFRKKSVPFVMELPPYRTPSARSLLIHMWERGSQFLRKMGGVILIGSIIIWTLGYFPRTTVFSPKVTGLQADYNAAVNPAERLKISVIMERQKKLEQMENSFIGGIGKTVEPFFQPLGLGWKEGVALITGVVGKEIVVSTISVLYGTAQSAPGELKIQMQDEGINQASAFGFLVFVLLYIPCLATIAAVRKETNSLKWTAFSIFYGIAVGYILALASHSIGLWIMGGF